MEEGKGKYIVYMKEHEHTIIEEGTYAIRDLPLVPVAKKSKKAFKENFQVVEGISDYEAACAAMSQNNHNIAQPKSQLIIGTASNGAAGQLSLHIQLASDLSCHPAPQQQPDHARGGEIVPVPDAHQLHTDIASGKVAACESKKLRTVKQLQVHICYLQKTHDLDTGRHGSWNRLAQDALEAWLLKASKGRSGSPALAIQDQDGAAPIDDKKGPKKNDAQEVPALQDQDHAPAEDDKKGSKKNDAKEVPALQDQDHVPAEDAQQDLAENLHREGGNEAGPGEESSSSSSSTSSSSASKASSRSTKRRRLLASALTNLQSLQKVLTDCDDLRGNDHSCNECSEGSHVMQNDRTWQWQG